MMPAPLIAHVVYRFDVGGLENGLVNLINSLPADRYRHAVICITDYTGFSARIRRPDVTLHALHKPPGNSWRLHAQLRRLFRELGPTIVHSRNLAALESQAAASIAGVPVRLHGEHGWDIGDLHGASRRHRFVRRLFKPFVHHYVAVSHELGAYLRTAIGVAPGRITQIPGGVDVERFRPRDRVEAPEFGIDAAQTFVVGSVGRMQAVKNPMLLARAFVRALALMPEARGQLRLAMVGDGPLRAEVIAFLKESGVADFAWVPGARDDIPEILRDLDVFVLPSLAEGVSNTILEAMATGLPVIATKVGGNSELVVADGTGSLVPSDDVESMARAILAHFCNRAMVRRRGKNARALAVGRFSLDAQVNGYQRLYDTWLAWCGSRSMSDQWVLGR
jgi:sugar transferase (PEP-CTERM/EpsH1 system associated)